MSSRIIYLLAIVCVCYSSPSKKHSQYNNDVKDKANQVCVKEDDMKQFLKEWCQKEYKYDADLIKNFYTEDATVIYLNEPPIDLQKHMDVAMAFKKEFNSYFNIKKCSDMTGSHKFLGCEQNTVPSALKGYAKLLSTDKKTSAKGKYTIEFTYVDGKVKISKVNSQIPIDEKVLKEIMSKITKKSGKTTTLAPEAPTTEEEDQDYEGQVQVTTVSTESTQKEQSTQATEASDVNDEEENVSTVEPDEVDEAEVN